MDSCGEGCAGECLRREGAVELSVKGRYDFESGNQLSEVIWDLTELSVTVGAAAVRTLGAGGHLACTQSPTCYGLKIWLAPVSTTCGHSNLQGAGLRDII